MALCDQSLPNIRAISPYLPGKPITQLAREMELPVERIVKLASNENPLGMSPKAKLAMEKAIVTLERYPDDFDLKSALSSHCGLGMERIVLGNGSNDVLDLIARVFLSASDSTLTPRVLSASSLTGHLRASAHKVQQVSWAVFRGPDMKAQHASSRGWHAHGGRA